MSFSNKLVFPLKLSYYNRVLNTSNQKTFIILIAVFLSSTLGVVSASAETLENFSEWSGKKIDENSWKSRNGDPNVVYKVVEEDNNHFLHADDKGSSVQLFRKKGWGLKDNPVISWRWRVTQFPKGSNEKSGLNDSAAGVYVVFPNRWFVPESIKYVWSDVLPVGTVIMRHDHFPMLVIRSGQADKGKWITEERNVYEDYKKLFDGRTPSNPVAFGFLTDANDTKSEAIADYDDFKAIDKLSGPVAPIGVAPEPKKTETKKPEVKKEEVKKEDPKKAEPAKPAEPVKK